MGHLNQLTLYTNIHTHTHTFTHTTVQLQKKVSQQGQTHVTHIHTHEDFTTQTVPPGPWIILPPGPLILPRDSGLYPTWNRLTPSLPTPSSFVCCHERVLRFEHATQPPRHFQKSDWKFQDRKSNHHHPYRSFPS